MGISVNMGVQKACPVLERDLWGQVLDTQSAHPIENKDDLIANQRLRIQSPDTTIGIETGIIRNNPEVDAIRRIWVI